MYAVKDIFIVDIAPFDVTLLVYKKVNFDVIVGKIVNLDTVKDIFVVDISPFDVTLFVFIKVMFDAIVARTADLVILGVVNDIFNALNVTKGK